MLRPAQVRMARAALRWSVRELAVKTGVADSTILRFESEKGTILSSNLARIQQSLEAAGIVFLASAGADGPGVRLNLRPE